MACDILDIKCIFVNELIGSVSLTLILLTIGFFIIASKNKFGFEVSVFGGAVILILGALIFGNFSVVFATLTIVIAVLFALEYSKLIGN